MPMNLSHIILFGKLLKFFDFGLGLGLKLNYSLGLGHRVWNMAPNPLGYSFWVYLIMQYLQFENLVSNI